MRESDRLSALGFCVGVALFLGLFVAVWAVAETGDCWNNCVAGEDTVMSPWPLAVWAGAVGMSWAGACAYVWARSFCATDTRRQKAALAAKASAMTLPLVWVLALAVQ